MCLLNLDYNDNRPGFAVGAAGRPLLLLPGRKHQFVPNIISHDDHHPHPHVDVETSRPAAAAAGTTTTGYDHHQNNKEYYFEKLLLLGIVCKCCDDHVEAGEECKLMSTRSISTSSTVGMRKKEYGQRKKSLSIPKENRSSIFQEGAAEPCLISQLVSILWWPRYLILVHQIPEPVALPILSRRMRVQTIQTKAIQTLFERKFVAGITLLLKRCLLWHVNSTSTY
ncbi:hypothetical protein BVC80_9033g24 [Macleaya cordata]|uniref:Uncharacterized protein n=1 Tax=Macleaya cordata TaxID=56857 RepID=A0A200QYM3_MACCD|nr:hypothetical protein BVC80_9033g24 [Macleaya cordata]